jgi:hypothetical protein
MKQLKLSSSLFFKSPMIFGGELNLKKRKSQRPLDIKKPLHLVLRAEGNKPVFLHQDLVIGFKQRYQHHFFVSALSGQIAQLLNIKWRNRPFTRIVEWGRDLKNVCAYVIKNQKEAWGLISYKPRSKKSRAGPSLQML